MTQAQGAGDSRQVAGSDAAEPSRAAKPCTPAEATQLIWAGADWIWETDAELRFSWLSESYQSVTGIDPATALGKFRFDFLESSARGDERAARHLEDLQAHRPFRDFVYAPRGAKAECAWIAITGFPRYDARGAFIGYRGIGRNITSMVAPLAAGNPVSAEVGDTAGEAPDHSDPQRMMAALNVMSDAFCYYDAEGSLTLYNEAAVAMFKGMGDVIRPGMTFEGILDAGLERDLWDTGDQTPRDWRAAVLELRREPPSTQTLKFMDGRFIMHREMRTDDGGLISICTDITELETRQAKLAKANKKTKRLLSDLERTLDSMTMGVVLLDAELNAEIINRAFFSIWRLQPGDLQVGAPFRALMDINRHAGIYQVEEADWESYVESRLAEIRSGDVAPREFVRADGCTMIYSVTSLSGGKRLVSYYDITEMKRREAELAESHESSHLARAVLDTIKDPIFVKDADLRFVFVNRAFATMFNTTPDKMAGAYADEFVSFEEAERFEESERDVLSTGELYEVEENFDFAGIGRSRIVRKTCVSMASGNRYVAGFLFDVTLLKNRETEALEARQQLEHVLESLPAGVIIYDRDDNFVLANRKLKDSLPGLAGSWEGGRTLSDALVIANRNGYFRQSGDPELDALYETDPEAWVSGYSRRYHVDHLVEERRNPDGRWFQIYDSRTPDGTYIGVRVDITELKEREKALRDSMRQIELFRHVLDELPVAAFIKSSDLRIEYVNKAWSSITGISIDEATGHTDRELFDAEEAEGFSAADTAVGQTGEGFDTEEAVTDRNGRVRQLMTRKGRLITGDGKVHLFGSSTDITEIKQRETLLKESLRENEVFHSLIDNLPVAIYAKKPDLKLFYVNNGWCDLTGFSKAYALGKTDSDIFGPQGEVFMDADRAVLADGTMREVEETLTGPSGEVRHQFARKGAFRASDGSMYLIGSSIDVTEQRQREMELRDAQKRAVLADRAKSEFLANMSHEIRTPMNGVLGMAELLAKSDLDPKQKTFTDIIVKSGNALLTIINDILDFSKIDAGQLTLDPAPFNLSEAIEDVATLISTRAKEKDLELIVRVAPNLQDLFVGDVGRIRQIITNLIGNAVKFTDSGHVLVDVVGETMNGIADLHISVTDTGIGIAAEKLDMVFEKFSQADASSTRRHEGTGLGLAITSRLVEMMGGQIGVQSTEGRGSTFWFTLSLPQAGKASSRRVTPVDVTGSRILIIDDNAINRAILLEQMASWRFDACAASSGQEGLQVLDAATEFGLPVDCIVLDYQMPGMSGLEMAAIVRRSAGFSNVPIVMLTSVDHSLGSAAYRDLLIDAQLIKPARSSTLLETLVLTIQRHRARSAGMSETRTGSPIVYQAPSGPDDDQALDLASPGAAVAETREHGFIPQRASIPAPVSVFDLPFNTPRVDILVAEDNEVNQLVFTQVLAETKLTFQIVGNGRLAVEAFQEMRPRIILMDISMPEMNGFEATAAIRDIEAGGASRTPIIGVTAHALKGDRERCMEAGMDDYLPKPISPKALLEKIDRWAMSVGVYERSAG